MIISFNKLRLMCIHRSNRNNICDLLKYYDCSESNCPRNDAAQDTMEGVAEQQATAQVCKPEEPASTR